MLSKASTDKYREWIAQIGSGLEQLWEALLHSYDSASYKSMTELGFQCMILSGIFTVLPYLAPSSFGSSLTSLFYPTLFLYRYLNPDPWDRLFMTTVRALKCADRTDIVAKPSPNYYEQLKRYIRRAAKALFGIATLQRLVGRTGFFSWPSIIMGLIATQQYLKYKGVKNPTWMLLCVALLMGPRWPVWGIRTLVLQQMLMYELLQPYLTRVDFKPWEERAWLSEHALELQGFALGAYFLCHLPLVGPAFIPVLFPAVAFLLTRSCGSMRNSSNGNSGDLLERLKPGLKTVALGQSISVSGDWDQISVATLVRDGEAKAAKPSTHNKSKNHYKINEGVHGAVSTAEALEDKDRTHHRRGTMHRDAENFAHGQAQRLRRRLMESSSSSSTTAHPKPQEFSTRPLMIPGGFPLDIPPQSFSSGSSSNSNGNGNGDSKSKRKQQTKADGTREDYTKYNFSDRKSDASVPSAPPHPAEGRNAWEYDEAEDGLFRELGEPSLNSGSGSRRTREEERQNAKEQRKMAKQQRRFAKEQRRTASEESQRASALQRSISESDTSDASDTKESIYDEEEEEDEEEDEQLEQEEENEDEDEDGIEYDIEETTDDPYMMSSNPRAGFGFRGGRGWDRWRGRGSPRGWTRGGRGGRGDPRGGRGFFRGYGSHGGPSRVEVTERPAGISARTEPEGDTSGGFNGISAITETISKNLGNLGIDVHITQTIEDAVNGWAKKWENPNELGSYIVKINSLKDLFSNENNDKSKKKK